jgi:hypothetical protein
MNKTRIGLNSFLNKIFMISRPSPNWAPRQPPPLRLPNLIDAEMPRSYEPKSTYLALGGGANDGILKNKYLKETRNLAADL